MENAHYVIYNNNNKYIGFTCNLQNAIKMANKYNGHYELEFVGSNSIFG